MWLAEIKYVSESKTPPRIPEVVTQLHASTANEHTQSSASGQCGSDISIH